MSHRILHPLLLTAALASIALPPSLAHDGGVGLVKTQCETAGETSVHEYAHSNGFLLAGDWITVNFFGPPAAEPEPRASSGPTTRLLQPLLGETADGAVPPCPFGDTTWDGHYEFAQGGARLQAAASVCTDAYADHSAGATIVVVDAVFVDVAFSVYSDNLNNDPFQGGPNCGDFESDYGVDCVNICAPAFPPGLDGTYQVYVSGTTGHVLGWYSACADGWDNDGDGDVDWPADLQCNGRVDNDEST